MIIFNLCSHDYDWAGPAPIPDERLGVLVPQTDAERSRQIDGQRAGQVYQNCHSVLHHQLPAVVMQHDVRLKFTIIIIIIIIINRFI